MYFNDADVVAELSLHLPTAELGPAMQACRSVVTLLNASAIRVVAADPDGARRGYFADLVFVSPPVPGESAEQSIRRAVRPLLRALRWSERRVRVVRSQPHGTYAHCDGPERGLAGGIVAIGLWVTMGRKASTAYPDGLAAARAGHEDQAQQDDAAARSRRRRVLQPPLADTDIAARIHLVTAERSLSAAAARCQPIIEETGASAIEVIPTALPGGSRGHAVALLCAVGQSADPQNGELLHRTAAPLAARFGLDDAGFTVDRRSTGPVGRLETAIGEPDRPAAGVQAHALYLRVGADPFDAAEPAEESEPRELVLLGGFADNATDEEIMGLLDWAAAHPVRVLLTVDVVGLRQTSATVAARQVADRLIAAQVAPHAEAPVTGPGPGGAGTLRVNVLFGPTDLSPLDSVAAATAALGTAGWTAPAVLDGGQHVVARWHPPSRPDRGVTGLQVQAAPGLDLPAGAP